MAIPTSFKFSVNQAVTTWTQAMYVFIQLLKTAGWTVTFSSDGTATSTPWTGDNISGYGSGAGGLGNTRAYMVLQQPTVASPYSGSRMIFIQRGASDSQWKIKYSRGSFGPPVSYGGAALQNMPSASDEAIVAGGGTDASPTFNTVFNGTAANNRIECFADNGSDVSSWCPGAFYFCSIPNGGAADGNGCNHAIWLDPLSGVDTVDVDPFVIGCSNQNGTCLTFTGDIGSEGAGALSANEGSGHAWFNPASDGGGVTRVFKGVQAMGLTAYNQVTWPGKAGTSTVNGKEVGGPIVWARRALAGGQGGPKGVSRLMKWKSSSKSVGDTCQKTDAYDLIVAGDVLLPWNGVIPTL